MTSDSEPKAWRDALGGQIPDQLNREIEAYEEKVELKRKNQIQDPIFNEMRLRRGVYGQRYDNGKRHDGIESRPLNFPSGALTKGVITLWDAPGMQRIKIPLGAMTADQMDVLADIADEYSNGILHVTTRQDIQLHYVHIDDTANLMRRLGAVGITTMEACGNAVRNVTACPLAGVCSEETFDVTPYARAVTSFLMGHPDAQDFGRKFKIAFSGCSQNACGLARMHDIGAVARVVEKDGERRRGFEFYVGGGLGAVPYQASVLTNFLPEEELLPTCQAIARVFGRLGEKKNRARARFKFLVDKLGIEELRRLVNEERVRLPHDPRWTEYLRDLHIWDEKPIKPAAPMTDILGSPAFEEWRATNVIPQAQKGYVTASITLPLGDLTSTQMRGLADIARRFTGDTVRNTVEQNIMLRWLSEADMPAFFEALDGLGLAAPGANTIVDITSCPGTDTCKLGIASSRGLAGELRKRLAEKSLNLDMAVKGLRIKVSGCFNSCGQHHVADIGFWGVVRKVGGRQVPHFQVVLGGQWQNNAGSYGLAIGAVPSKNIPLVVDRIADHFLCERQGNESFQDFIKRVGKVAVRAPLEDLFAVPEQAAPSFFTDWGDARVYTKGDIGKGECAGEMVSPVEFWLQGSEREAFEAQDRLDKGDVEGAADIAYRSMLKAAKALITTSLPTISENPEEIVEEFRTRFHETEIFHDPFAGAKFARYIFRAHEEVSAGKSADKDLALKRIEEALLFIEAAHACYGRLDEKVLV